MMQQLGNSTVHRLNSTCLSHLLKELRAPVGVLQSSEERLARREMNASELEDGDGAFDWPEFPLENELLEPGDIDVLMGLEFRDNRNGNGIAGIQNQCLF
ncbi:hypothetical protein V6N13_027111 [Hibiscus sabdariffa]|uniref:Uncharacterized protein n=2 Tax=Hibiscus sabdariffa TaxID=183260 RepID=A0ABR2B3L3_9ROSI